MYYRSTKTYTHSEGLSCCFRNHRADSHCRFLHGYALQFKFVFEATSLDNHGWVVDFGNLKELKEFLKEWFDHKTLIAADDPYLSMFQQMHKDGIIDLREVEGVGCEAFAEMAFRFADSWLAKNYYPRVSVISVEVTEHGSNSAMYRA